MASDHSIHALFSLSLEDAVAKFIELRADFLKNKEKRVQEERDRIDMFAHDVRAGVAGVRKFHPLYRAHSISTKLLPLWHRYNMHPYFPLVMRKLPECLVGVSDPHLDELEDVLRREQAIALESVQNETLN
jgi:hypothetical protein